MTKDEKQKVSKVISEYAECYNQIEKLEHDIKQLLHQKNNLVKTLKHIRNTEKHIVEKLKKKYGEEAGIDLEKLEIINGKA